VSTVRERIRMTDDEVAAFLATPRKLQLATVNADGTPHLVTMYYDLIDGRVAFWTYRKAQKAVNLRRDPRVTCLVEDGWTYDELRGVQLSGRAVEVQGTAAVRDVGERIYRRYREEAEVTSEVAAYLDDQARKRTAYVVEAERIASWDHRKLAHLDA
jgi:PPOX class probable F420-dependent enzyme